MKISVVTTLYHSAPFVQEFYERMVAEVKKLTEDYEIIFVNDGSPDNSAELALALQSTDPDVVLIDLSRNFGHQKALITGLTHASGDYVFMIDSDLEEAPELLSTYWEELKKFPDTDVIYGIQHKRKGNWFERVSGKLYYYLFSLLSKQDYPANSLTARLMSRQYVLSLEKFSEKESDLWGIFILAGFRQKGIIVQKGYKGRTTYNLRRKLGIALATITTLTHKPLYLVTLTGILLTLLSSVYAIVLLIRYIITGNLDKWNLLMGSVWLLGGIIVLSMGVISVYISKMFLEIKNRPFSIIKKIHRKK